jgi:predicted GNAT family acetyltransferase
MTFEITHDRANRRFETRVEGQHCVLGYELRGDTMVIVHVVVPDPVGGRGIAAELTRQALETARAEGWRVVPQCPYAAAYVERHPMYSDLIA